MGGCDESKARSVPRLPSGARIKYSARKKAMQSKGRQRIAVPTPLFVKALTASCQKPDALLCVSVGRRRAFDFPRNMKRKRP